MTSVIARCIAGFIFHRLGPLLRFFRLKLRLLLKATHRMTSSKHTRDDIVRRYFRIGPDFKSRPRNRESPISAVEDKPAHSLASPAGRALTILAYGRKTWIFYDGILAVRHFAVVFEIKSAAGAVYRFWSLYVQE